MRQHLDLGSDSLNRVFDAVFNGDQFLTVIPTFLHCQQQEVAASEQPGAGVGEDTSGLCCFTRLKRPKQNQVDVDLPPEAATDSVSGVDPNPGRETQECLE